MGEKDLYLAHHGIKGMRWGVRRFQNEDGTLKTAGKHRYFKKSSKKESSKNNKKTKKKRKRLTKQQKETLKALGVTGATFAAEILGLYALDKFSDHIYEQQREKARQDDERFWKDYEKRQQERREDYRRARETAENARRQAEEAYRQAYEDYSRYSSSSRTGNRNGSSSNSYTGNRNNYSSNNYKRTPKPSTASTKSKDRAAKYKGTTLDPKKTQARVDKLREQVAQAQRDGTLTAQMVSDLQEAMAVNKAAKASMAHSLGHIWRIRKEPDSLYHYGIRGMKWGIRRFEDESGHLTPAGKRRYGIQDARKYYKINRLQRLREKIPNKKARKILDGEIRRTKTRSDRKKAILSGEDVRIGREIVAKNRLKWAGFNTAAKTALTAAGAAYLYQNPNTRALAPLAAAGGAALTFGSAKKIPYYFMENRRYKQANKKGDTQKGLTKKQQKMRKIGKVALGIGATAAVAGTSAYLLSKAAKSKRTADALNNASEATRAIYRANKQRAKERAAEEFRSKAKETAKNAAKTVGRTAFNVGKAAGRKTASTVKKGVVSGAKAAANAVKNRVTADFDPDDLGTYYSTVRNVVDIKQDVEDKINTVRTQPVAAAGMVARGAVNGTRNLIERFKNRRVS